MPVYLMLTGRTGRIEIHINKPNFQAGITITYPQDKSTNNGNLAGLFSLTFLSLALNFDKYKKKRLRLCTLILKKSLKTEC